MIHVLRRTTIVMAGIALIGAAAGCGSSAKHATATATHTTTTRPSATADPAKANSSTATTASLRAALTAVSHHPVAGKNFAYTVRATSSSGTPLAGSVETDFVVSPLGVVGKETPAVHKLANGTLNDNVQFPTSAVGQPLALVTVVHTSAGSVALAWPVSVTK